MLNIEIIPQIDRDKMRPNFQFLARFFSNLLKTAEVDHIEEVAAAASTTIEDNDNDENENQHSNTVYV